MSPLPVKNKKKAAHLFQYNESRAFNIWVHAGMAAKIIAAIALLIWMWRTL